MAQKESGTSKRAGRLASAKVTAAAAADARAKRAKKSGVGGRSRGASIAIMVFAVIMALSMMLPSLSAIFAPSRHKSGGAAPLDLARIDKSYSTSTSSLEEKLAADPQDQESLLALGGNYMSWAYAARQLASTDADRQHVGELWKKAIESYDRYLALADSEKARLNRSLCQHYSGDTAGALSSLEQLTAAHPDFAPAWANYGMILESSGRPDDARSAYERAQQADPNNEQGAKSFADKRLEALNAASAKQ
ncbi:tetratricopeptide repeat protein [Olsenella urininfantis]|uniref:tetratricopeptide repeat protein n=1 Tax=Olsenella urininfantis TaxID=1871033 RepID=UPI0013566DAE|nr:tetratricopeptide repeat protein [Olsenella urininfantis]